jgi:hypothetical protein
MKITIFCYATLPCLVDDFLCFERIHCHHSGGRRIRKQARCHCLLATYRVYFYVLKMETVRSTKASLSFYQETGVRISEFGVLAADRQSTSSPWYRASLWGP